MAHLTPTGGDLGTIGSRILGPDGILSRTLPGYEARQPQIDMADLVGATLDRGLNAPSGETATALVEAGTGTGKSLAYLIPAILSGQRVIVSTGTIALQQQLVGKDLPFLAEHLGVPFTYAIAKGRGNYFCERNAFEFLEQAAILAPSEGRYSKMGDDAHLVNLTRMDFEADAWDGDKSTLEQPVPDRLWASISGEESCTGSECAHATRCPYLKAKAKYAEAQVIVTNHTFYLLHHYLLSTVGAEALPEHSIWIADEAHELPDKAGDVWGIELRHTSLGALLKRLGSAEKRFGIAMPDSEEWLRDLNRTFFGAFRSSPKAEPLLSEYPADILQDAGEAAEGIDTLLEGYLSPLWRAASQLIGPDQRSQRTALERLAERTQTLGDAFQLWFEAHPPGTVRYAEIEQNNRIPASQCAVSLLEKPIETAAVFQVIADRLRAQIFCSATLATGTGANLWTPTRTDLGLDTDTPTLRVESPFDYARQVRGYVPPVGRIPKADSDDYHDRLTDELVEIIRHTGGGVFVLFTSNWDMRKISEKLPRRLPSTMFLVQGSAPKEQILEEFRQDGDAVLLGVKTFWTGVDIAGSALRGLVITKIPFPVPSAPLNRARCDVIKARGGSDFKEFSIPRAIMDLRQGFGRLIRNRTDTGVFAFLDPRIRTARYGGLLLGALPEFKVEDRL